MLATAAAAEPKDPTQSDSIDAATNAIGEKILQPMTRDLQDRMMRRLAEKGGTMSKPASEYLEKRKIEEQIAYDEEMKKKHTAIMEDRRCKVNCKPRPISECMKPDFTIDDEVLGCSEGTITKYWQ